MKGEKSPCIHLNYFLSLRSFLLSGNHAAHLSFQYRAECAEWTPQSGPCNENVYSSSPSWKEAPLEDSVSLIEMLLNLHVSINAGGEAFERRKTMVPCISHSIREQEQFPVQMWVYVFFIYLFLNSRPDEYIPAPTELTPHSDAQRPADTNQ